MKERKPLTKIGFIIIMSIGILIFVAAVGSLIYAAILQDQGAKWNDIYIYVIVCFALLIADILFLLLLQNKTSEYEFYRDVNKIKNKKTVLKNIDNITCERVEKACLINGFTKENGFFCKTKLNGNGFCNYFLKCIDARDIGSAIDNEIEQFNKLEFEIVKMTRSCQKRVILFVFCDCVDSIDLKNLVEYSKMVYGETTAVGSMISYGSPTVILVDKFSNKAHYVQIGKFNEYAADLKVIKKLLH